MIVWPDRYLLGYWHLPALLDGARRPSGRRLRRQDGRIHVDDRTLAPLTVAGDDFDRARARVGSYRNTMLVVRSRDLVVPADRLRAAVRTGLRGHGRTTSAAHRTPSRCRPGGSGPGCWWHPGRRRRWPTSVRRRSRPVPGAGQRLGRRRARRDDRRQPTPAVRRRARARPPRCSTSRGSATRPSAGRRSPGRWHTLAETALPDDVPAIARACGANRRGHRSGRRRRCRPDRAGRGRRGAVEAAWPHAAEPPLGADEIAAVLAGMSGILGEIYEAEKAAIQRLGAVMRIQSRR